MHLLAFSYYFPGIQICMYQDMKQRIATCTGVPNPGAKVAIRNPIAVYFWTHKVFPLGQQHPEGELL
jgi:hypothetical protein